MEIAREYAFRLVVKIAPTRGSSPRRNERLQKRLDLAEKWLVHIAPERLKTDIMQYQDHHSYPTDAATIICCTAAAGADCGMAASAKSFSTVVYQMDTTGATSIGFRAVFAEICHQCRSVPNSDHVLHELVLRQGEG